MKVIVKLEESNFDAGLFTSNTIVEVYGSDILSITSGNQKYNFDVKSTVFTEDKFMLEGIISNQKELLGRCLLSFKSVHLK